MKGLHITKSTITFDADEFLKAWVPEMVIGTSLLSLSRMIKGIPDLSLFVICLPVIVPVGIVMVMPLVGMLSLLGEEVFGTSKKHRRA